MEDGGGRHRALEPDVPPEPVQVRVAAEVRMAIKPAAEAATSSYAAPSFLEARRLLDTADTTGLVHVGDPIQRISLPRLPSPASDRTNSAAGVTDFLRQVWGHVSADQACEAVQNVSQGVAQYGAGPGRRRVFEASIDLWRESNGLWTFIENLMTFYGANEPGHCLRNDLKTGDEYGSNIHVGASRRQRFLLVDKAAILRTLAGTPYVGRVVDFVDIARRGQVNAAVNEFSLPEELAVDAALTKKGLDDEEKAKIMGQANRLTVRSLGDLEVLIRTSREKEERDRHSLKARVARLASWRTVSPNPDWPDEMLH